MCVSDLPAGRSTPPSARRHSRPVPSAGQGAAGCPEANLRLRLLDLAGASPKLEFSKPLWKAVFFETTGRLPAGQEIAVARRLVQVLAPSRGRRLMQSVCPTGRLLGQARPASRNRAETAAVWSCPASSAPRPELRPGPRLSRQPHCRSQGVLPPGGEGIALQCFASQPPVGERGGSLQPFRHRAPSAPLAAVGVTAGPPSRRQGHCRFDRGYSLPKQKEQSFSA